MASIFFPALSLPKSQPHRLAKIPTAHLSPIFIPRWPILGAGVLGLPTVSMNRNLVSLYRNLSGIRAESPDREKGRAPMMPPYNVLITGSTKGIGYALAKEFLKAGDNIVICSRSAERVESAVQKLREEFGEQHVGLSVMLEKGRMSKL